MDQASPFDQTSNPEYCQFIHTSRYARWLPEENRRETWAETVERYVRFFVNRGQLSGKMAREVGEAIYNLEVMPSMRALMTAGAALEESNVAGFNCSYVAVDSPRAFDETMYILMCGTGLGFSVESQYVKKLPEVAEDFHETDTTIIVRDSKKGWAKAFRELIALLYTGQVPKWDVSQVRPKGARLKKFGGRASGSEPLVELFYFTVELFRTAAGRKLTNMECHDLMCKIAQIVVVGGVRRSALISLSNLTDDRIRHCKNGQNIPAHRYLSNNSVAYTVKPDADSFMREVMSLYEGRSGERGFFSRPASQAQAAKNGRRDAEWDFGTNPCSEIILRPNQFCNLSEVVVRAEDTLEDLLRKIRIATIVGTLQATLTDFEYIRPVWRKNTEEEALLGVSLTGIQDHPILNGSQVNDALRCHEFCGNEDWTLAEILETMRDEAIKVNKTWASKLGINQSAAITCVKPSGTVSQLVDSASGIHDRYAPFYIRRVLADRKDPLCKFMQAAGFPNEQAAKNSDAVVFSFPVAAPLGSCDVKRTAIQQLEHWRVYQEHWCEHKPSITINYRDDEFLGAMQWVYDNFDTMSGVSFLPTSDTIYVQAPYEEITGEQYWDMVATMPSDVDWAGLAEFELEDSTAGAKELACSAGVCEVVDLVNPKVMNDEMVTI